METIDNWQYENELFAEGYNIVCGVDEVGRGPLVGPVVTACVVLPRDFVLEGLTDSKKLTEKKRDKYYDYIINNCTAYAVGECSPEEIDKYNILEATKIAMKRAIDETKRRRTIQEEYNEKHNITPKTIIKEIRDVITNTDLDTNKKDKKLSKKEIIHNMEEYLNVLFNEMEKIQGDEKNPDEIFKRIVEKIKLKNKAKKHQEGREALLKLEEEKNLKYLQRMNRYKIRGPIVYPPPWVLKRKKGSLDKKKKVEDNYEEMLYYI